MDTIDYTSRFKDADWMGEPKDIILGGLGGIGNGVATELVKLGHKLYIYEFDDVEYYNCIPQGFFRSQVGMSKYEAFKQTVSAIVDKWQLSSEGKYTESSMANDIMFSCFDNMEARKLMFNKWKGQDDRKLFIDGRLLAEVFQVFVVQKGDEARYERHLFDDSEVETEPCTYKQTSHIAKMLHGYIINLFNAWVVNQKHGMVIRPMPFFSEYMAPMNMWNYED